MRQCCDTCNYSQEHVIYYGLVEAKRELQCWGQKNAPTVRRTDCCDDWRPKVDTTEEYYYKGYHGILYGNSSLSVIAPDGKEVFHTGNRLQKDYTRSDMIKVIENVITLLEARE